MKSRPIQLTRETSRAAANTSSGGKGNRQARPVVQRQNHWYGEGPRATEVENPLFTIAGAVEHATGIGAGKILSDWGKGTNLKIAKTYRGMLTSGSLAKYLRPESASAWLDTPNRNPGKRKDPAWITAIGNLGSIEDQIKGDNVSPYNGGHLIAWEFLNDEANVYGNIAPQAALQNQALFRRIERSVEEAAKQRSGVEVTVTTPYNSDNYTVTMDQLIQRGVIANQNVIDQLTQENALQDPVTLSQMAPDTYDVYYLTQTGVLDIATPDSREGRNNIETKKLPSYGGQEVNKLQNTGKLKPQTILASNFNETTGEQEATAFAHIVFLNYRSNPGADVDMGLAEDPIVEPKYSAEQVKLARDFIEGHLPVAIPLINYLKSEFDMSPTEAEHALIYILLTDHQ